MPLTDTAIRGAKPADKPYKLADEKGLFLLIHPNTSKYWRMKYHFNGKESGEHWQVSCQANSAKTHPI